MSTVQGAAAAGEPVPAGAARATDRVIVAAVAPVIAAGVAQTAITVHGAVGIGAGGVGASATATAADDHDHINAVVPAAALQGGNRVPRVVEASA